MAKMQLILLIGGILCFLFIFVDPSLFFSELLNNLFLLAAIGCRSIQMLYIYAWFSFFTMVSVFCQLGIFGQQLILLGKIEGGTGAFFYFAVFLYISEFVFKIWAIKESLAIGQGKYGEGLGDGMGVGGGQGGRRRNDEEAPERPPDGGFRPFGGQGVRLGNE